LLRQLSMDQAAVDVMSFFLDVFNGQQKCLSHTLRLTPHTFALFIIIM
jgi:hypothetical protein